MFVLASAQVKVFVTGLFSLNQDIPAFKEHLRDFLVQIKVRSQLRSAVRSFQVKVISGGTVNRLAAVSTRDTFLCRSVLLLKKDRDCSFSQFPVQGLVC